MINKCKFCSYSHKRGSCPAYGKICNNCKKRGHFSKCCTKARKQINQIEQQNETESDEGEPYENFS